MQEQKDRKKVEVKEEKTTLSRNLGVFQLTMMGAGMMIGAGVFVATGIAIGKSGPGGILLAFALNGLIAIFTAMSFAELCSAMPEAGGAYAQVKKAFGGFTGFISGWMNWFALSVAGSLYSITFSKYTLHLLETFEFFNRLNLNTGLWEKILAVVVALVFIFINYKGVEDTGKSSTIIALGQTFTLGIIGVLGVAVALKDPSRLTNFSPFAQSGWMGVLLAMGFTYVGFEGFEVIGHAGEEAINPRKNIPRAILYAVIIVVTTYILVAFAAVIGSNPEGVANVADWFAKREATGFADAVQALAPFGGVLVTLAAIFSSTSALNATLFSSTRVSFAMSRDGFLPKKLMRISKNQVPDIALACSSAIVLVVVLLLDVEAVAAAADIMFLLLFMLINISVIKIRKDMGDELTYGFLMPFFPYIPIVALVLQLVLAILLFELSMLAWISAGLWIAVGIVMYFAYSKKNGKKVAQKFTLEEEAAQVQKDYQVMLPVRSGGISDILAKYAARVAKYFDGELLLTRIVSVPHYLSEKEARAAADRKRGILLSSKESVDIDVPISTVMGRAETAASGIVRYIREKNTDMVVLGWKGYTSKSQYQMGNTIDRVIERAPSNIMIVKPGEEGLHTGKEIKKVLLPLGGYNNSLLAIQIANALMADDEQAEVTLLNVNVHHEPEDKIMNSMQPILKHLGAMNWSVKITYGDDVVEAILKESQDHDLLVLGASTEGLLKQMLFGQIPEKIASRCKKTVVLVKRDLGIQSFIKRWLGKR
jgi:amino acid transporter/nucleotide-binding universal stress UspA family protein